MNNRLTIQDIAGLLAERTGKDRQQAELFLKEFIAQIREGVYSDKIAKIKGVGTFKIIPVDPRESIHVATGERFVIPAHYKFSFLPDKELRDLVNKPFSFFETTELNENVGFTDLEESEEAEDKEADSEDESIEEVMPDEPGSVVAPVPSEPEAPHASEISPDPEEPKEPLTDETEPGEENQPVCTEEIVDESLSTPEEEPIEEDFNKEEQREEKIIEEELKEEKLPEEEIPEEEIPEEECPEEDNPFSPLSQSPADLQEEEIPVETTPGFPDVDDLKNKKNAASFRQYIVLGFALLMCCIGGTYLYTNRHFIRAILFGVEVAYPDSPADNREAITPALEMPACETEAVVDTVAAVDTTKLSTDAGLQPEPAPQPASTILATVKIEPGSRLTLISLEYYGSKIFWVYLYEYNKARIHDPNNIPVGTTIEVPAPGMYGIDAHDKASIAKAAARQTEILAGKK